MTVGALITLTTGCPVLERIFELAQKRLEEAENEYGKQEDCFGDIAACWSVLFKTQVTDKQVALAMIQLKIIRENFKPKLDNRGDMAGYAACADRLSKPVRRYTEKEAHENDLQDLPKVP